MGIRKTKTAAVSALPWWEKTATKITGLPVAQARVISGPTAVHVKSSFGRRTTAVFLDVSGDDLDALAHSDAGRWLITQQYTLAAASPPRSARWAKRIQVMLAAGAGVAALLAVAGEVAAWAGMIFAAVLTVGAAWIAWERRTARIVAVCKADAKATDTYGPGAATAALSARPVIYRSSLHEFAERRSPISVRSRLDRVPTVA